MKEEKELYERVGKKNPFSVPEGYFEHFTQEVMDRLPEKEIPVTHIRMWERVKPWLYMTAMFVGLMCTVQMFMGEKTAHQAPENTSQHISDLPDEYLDPILNQTLMDDYELYQYLTDAEPAIYN